MKKFSKYILGIVLLSIVSACTDFVEPAIPYNNFETGTYLRTITAPKPIDFFQLDTEKFSVEVEAHALNNENNVKEVELFVKHRRGNKLTPEVKLLTVPGTSFAVTSGAVRPRATISTNMTQVLSALGFTKASIDGGDFFEFRLVLTTNDGKVFSNNNLSADVSGGAYYASPFLYRVAVVCPSNLAGTYAYETTNIKAGAGGNAGACGPAITGSITLTATATVGSYTISDASFGQFACAWGDTPPGGNVRFNDACGKISMNGTDKYGDSYSLEVVSVEGNKLTFNWKNTYGDSGTTTLTRAGGNWPNGTR